MRSFRYIAPAGTPIRLSDLANWLASAGSGKHILDEFRKSISSAFGVRHCYFISSGRAALALIIQSLKKMTGNGRSEVIVPSYTCYSVPASIIRAGLKIRICDVDPLTLDYDYDKLAKTNFRNVLGIVSSNLYGIPNDLSALSIITEKNGLFLVDDAAQCMGGKVNGRFVGTFGTAGLYSLDKGKNISSIEGGIIVTDSDELAQHISSEIAILQQPPVLDSFKYIAKLLFYAAFLRPSLYWIPANIPFLKLGTTVYDIEYPIRAYSGLFSAMGLQLFRYLEEINRIRIANAEYLRKYSNDIPGITIPEYKNHISPVFLRFPVLIQNRKIRDTIVKALQQKGIGASTSYPGSIIDIQEIKDSLTSNQNDAKGGRMVAEQIVTLPTHPYVTEKDLQTIVSTMKDICKHS